MVTTLVRVVTIRTHEHEFFIVIICTLRDKSVSLIIIRTHAHEIVGILSSTNGHEFDSIVTIRTMDTSLSELLSFVHMCTNLSLFFFISSLL